MILLQASGECQMVDVGPGLYGEKPSLQDCQSNFTHDVICPADERLVRVQTLRSPELEVNGECEQYQMTHKVRTEKHKDEQVKAARGGAEEQAARAREMAVN